MNFTALNMLSQHAYYPCKRHYISPQFVAWLASLSEVH